MSATVRTPLFTRYEVLGELGAGGWGMVYKARHKVMGRMVALKVLPPAFREDTEAQERFKREAMVLAHLDHPHIARIYDAEIEQNVPYLAMELIEGRDLEKVMADERRLAVEATIRLGLELAEALDHVHRAGIVHRDVKPSNIIIRPDGAAVLTDFGIAFSTALPRITREVPGTPEYMSPEQVDGRTVDGLSDLYSLGVVLYKCLTGIEPFKLRGESLTALNTLIQRILKEAPPPVYLRRPEAPTWLVDVIGRCMAKAPADRFPSGQALAEALRAGAASGPDAAPLLEPTFVPLPVPAEPPNPEPAATTDQPDDETPEPEPVAVTEDQPDEEIPEQGTEPVVDTDLRDETLEPEPVAQQPDETPEPVAVTEDQLDDETLEPGPVAVTDQPDDETPQPVAPEASVAREPDRAPAPSSARSSSKIVRWAGLLVGGIIVLGAVGYATGMIGPPDTPAPLASMLAGLFGGDTTLTGNGGSALPDSSAAFPTEETFLPAPDTLAIDSLHTPSPDSLVEQDTTDSLVANDTTTSVKPPPSIIPPKPDPTPVPLAQMTVDALLADGTTAYRNKAYGEARRFLEEAARRGAAEAHYLLGSMSTNPAQAATHYRAAAERGHRDAQYALAVQHLRANAGPGQDQAAVQLLEQAAAQGHRDAQATLGVLYEEGKRTRRNTREAATWYKKAATQGHRTAQYRLAEMYREGRSIEPDNQEALRWYLTAANQNHADAQYWVGRFYEQGRGGVPQSDEQARAWYEKAAAQGQEDAQRALARAAQ